MMNKSLTEAEVKAKLDQIVDGMLHPNPANWLYGPARTTVGWMGVEFTWKPGRKRDGNQLKRGKAYGSILITRYADGLPLTRDKAIQEILKPPDQKKLESRLRNTVHCTICGKTANAGQNFYEDETRRWRSVSIDDITIRICYGCLVRLARREKARWQNN